MAMAEARRESFSRPFGPALSIRWRSQPSHPTVPTQELGRTPVWGRGPWPTEGPVLSSCSKDTAAERLSTWQTPCLGAMQLLAALGLPSQALSRPCLLAARGTKDLWEPPGGHTAGGECLGSLDLSLILSPAATGGSSPGENELRNGGRNCPRTLGSQCTSTDVTNGMRVPNYLWNCRVNLKPFLHQGRFGHRATAGTPEPFAFPGALGWALRQLPRGAVITR